MFGVICDNVLEGTKKRKGKNSTTPDCWIIGISKSLILDLRVQTPEIVSAEKDVVKTLTLQLLITLSHEPMGSYIYYRVFPF